jgi:hypothetical protein
VREAVADDGVDGGRRGGGGSVFCVLPTYLALSYEASKIWKLSRRLPADFQELPLSAVTRLVVTHTLRLCPQARISYPIPLFYKNWYNRCTFTLFLLSKRFEVHTSKVLYPQFLYEIPFYVRGGKRANKERDHDMKRQLPTMEVAVSRH